MRNENMYGWLLTFNPYEDTWYAATRDNYMSLFNKRDENLISVKGVGNIMTLVDIINKTAGNPEKIKELLG